MEKIYIPRIFVSIKSICDVPQEVVRRQSSCLYGGGGGGKEEG